MLPPLRVYTEDRRRAQLAAHDLSGSTFDQRHAERQAHAKRLVGMCDGPPLAPASRTDLGFIQVDACDPGWTRNGVYVLERQLQRFQGLPAPKRALEQAGVASNRSHVHASDPRGDVEVFEAIEPGQRLLGQLLVPDERHSLSQ